MDYIKHAYIILAIIVIAFLSFDRYELVPSHTGGEGSHGYFMKIDKLTGSTYMINTLDRKEVYIRPED